MTVVFQRVQRCIPGQGSQSLCWKDAEWTLGNTLGKGSAVPGGTKGTSALFFSEVVCDVFPPRQL